MKNNISIIMTIGNEVEMVEGALESAKWADEIICVLANSSDGSEKIIRRYTSNVTQTKDSYGRHYGKWRNLGLKEASRDWVFYLDGDERITPELKKKLIEIATSDDDSFSSYAIPRQNYYLGKKVRFGGSYPDYVKRFFKRSSLKKWQGDVHEEPIIEGEMGKLKENLLHFSHRDLASMLEKTIIWTQTEAEALFESGHPPVVWWRFFRMMFTKFWERVIVQQAWRDGIAGWINSIFEVFNTFIIYARLWQMQQEKKK